MWASARVMQNVRDGCAFSFMMTLNQIAQQPTWLFLDIHFGFWTEGVWVVPLSWVCITPFFTEELVWALGPGLLWHPRPSLLSPGGRTC